jgi:YesN/AraC family two-component response regulator
MKFCQLKLTNEADDLSVFAKAIDLHQQNNRKIKLHAIKHVFSKKRHYLCSVIKRTKEPERVLEERIKRLRITTIGNKDLKGPLRRAPRRTITKLEIKIQ